MQGIHRLYDDVPDAEEEDEGLERREEEEGEERGDGRDSPCDRGPGKDPPLPERRSRRLKSAEVRGTLSHPAG